MAFTGAITKRVGDFAEAARVLSQRSFQSISHVIDATAEQFPRLGSSLEDRTTRSLIEKTMETSMPTLEGHVERINEIFDRTTGSGSLADISVTRQVNTSLDERFARQLGKRKTPDIKDFVHFHGHVPRADRQIARETIAPLIEEYPDVAKQMSGVHIYGTGVAKYGRLFGEESRRLELRGGLGVSYGNVASFIGREPVNRIDIALPNLKRGYSRVGTGIGKRRIEELGNASTLLHDTLIHEFGHQIHFAANRGFGGEMTAMPRYISSLLEEKVPGFADPLLSLYPADRWAKENLSEYATSDPGEFMAEIFTHHKLYGDNPIVNEIAETTKNLTRLNLTNPPTQSMRQAATGYNPSKGFFRGYIGHATENVNVEKRSAARAQAHQAAMKHMTFNA